MKTKSYLRILIASLVCMAYGCTQQDFLQEKEQGGMQTEPDKAKVVFRLNQNLAREAEEPQEDEEDGNDFSQEDEKKANNLYVAVFDAQANDKGEGILHELIELKLPETPEGEIMFDIAQEGVYNLCFVANADETLAGKMKALKSRRQNPDEATKWATISQFNALQVTQAPDSKKTPGLLMTSRYITGVEVHLGGFTDIGTIGLDRAMARIDIVNEYDGLTVNKLVFKNMTDQSSLQLVKNELNEEYLVEKDIVKDELSLQGSSTEPATYEAQVYTYEQLADEQSEKRPKVEIYYTMGGQKEAKKLEVDFTLKENQYEEVLPLERNHLYRIILRQSNQVNLRIEVLDWESGAVLAYDNIEIGDAVKPEYTNLKVGDFLTKDGGYISYSAELQLTEEQKKEIVGVVFSLYFPPQTSPTLIDPMLEQEYPECKHGWAVALKNLTEEPVKWQNTSVDVRKWIDNEYPSYTTDYSMTTMTYTQLLLLNEFNHANPQEQYVCNPAKLAMEYRKKHREAPGTGWLLPCAYGSYFNSTGYNAANTSLTLLGAEYAATISGYYWTISEDSNSNYAYITDFGSRVDDYGKQTSYNVRLILAF